MKDYRQSCIQPAYRTFKKHDILYEYQSRFRSKHSVNTCLTHLSNQILKGFESGKSTGMILIDLQKAFDTIDHEILSSKLDYCGT